MSSNQAALLIDSAQAMDDAVQRLATAYAQ
jgi:hypothetical protein